MPPAIRFEVEVPANFADFRLPGGVQHRLHELLDRQDTNRTLTDAERQEAQGLVDMAEWLSLLRLRAERLLPQQGA